MKCPSCGCDLDLDVKVVRKGNADWRKDRPTEKQVAFLKNNGIDGTTMTKGEASEEIDRILKEGR